LMVAAPSSLAITIYRCLPIWLDEPIGRVCAMLGLRLHPGPPDRVGVIGPALEYRASVGAAGGVLS
jgi:hypothetical protein